MLYPTDDGRIARLPAIIQLTRISIPAACCVVPVFAVYWFCLSMTWRRGGSSHPKDKAV